MLRPLSLRRRGGLLAAPLGRLQRWVTPGELTGRRGGDSRAAAVSLLLCSWRVLDLPSQHTGLSERRNVLPSVPRRSGDALIFSPLLRRRWRHSEQVRCLKNPFLPAVEEGRGRDEEGGAGLSWHRCPLRMCDISRHEGEKPR